MEAKFIDIDGIATRYLTAGAGYPIVLVHGVGMAADSWIKNIAPLAERFRVIAPDCLGSGFTGIGRASDAPPQVEIVRHLSRLIDRLGIERFALIGSSLGGLIATLQYFAMPARVDSLAVVGSAALLAAEQPDLKKVFEASYQNGSRAYADNSLETARKRLAGIVVDVRSIPDTVLLMQLTSYALPWSREAYERRLKGLIACLDGREEGWVAHRLGQVAVPAMALAGRQDPRTNPAWEERAIARMPKGRCTIFENCGHFPHLEHPDRFNALIADFVASSRAA